MDVEVLARTSTENGAVQLVEHKQLGCFLQWVGPGDTVIGWSAPLSSDPASLEEARELGFAQSIQLAETFNSIGVHPQ